MDAIRNAIEQLEQEWESLNAQAETIWNQQADLEKAIEALKSAADKNGAVPVPEDRKKMGTVAYVKGPLDAAKVKTLVEKCYESEHSSYTSKKGRTRTQLVMFVRNHTKGSAAGAAEILDEVLQDGTFRNTRGWYYQK